MLHNATLCFLIILCMVQTTNEALAQTSDIEEFFLLIDERLSHMEYVALHKVKNKIAIEDIVREQFVIESAVKSAAELGLFGPSVESFFEAQISIAKAIQYRHLADWLSKPPQATAPDLEVIRPKLSDLGESIVRKLAKLVENNNPVLEQHRELFYDTISTKNVSKRDKAMLFGALLLIEK
ncbi:MAG: gamma subclass chorismate mutase AroQ [Pseudohongiellaceae bacterium]